MNAGLLGRTLGHSLSPLIHRFFADGSYRLFAREPEAVEDFVRHAFEVERLDFLNVTVPYKRTVFALCDELTDLARRLGNVNLVRRSPSGALVGDNTDAFGFARLLDSAAADVRGRNAAVLGAGGAALTAKAVLEDRGARRVTLVRRGEEPAADDEIVVNATPVGMWPASDAARIDISRFPACRTVLDLVYNPSPTRLVREARACGKCAADGLVMLVAQAFAAHAEAAPGTLFLYGPPASGKSTWARVVAAATGWACIDLDAEIVRRAGRAIPDVFAAEGEQGFRKLERAALEEICAAAAPSGRVVALGGGALLDPACRRLAESAGRIVVLEADAATLKSRLTGADRPLSADPAALDALLASRAAHYASFARPPGEL